MFDNSPRALLLASHEERLERWFERDMDALDEALLAGALTREEYDREAKTLERHFREDLADIYAG